MRTLLLPLVALSGLVSVACGSGPPDDVLNDPAASADAAAPVVSAVKTDTVASNEDAPELDALARQFVGVWRSVYDEKEVVTIKADGTWVNSYDGNPAPTDRWMVFAGRAPPAGLTQSFESTKFYVQVVPVEWPPQVSEIGDIGPNDLELFYTRNGRRNAYTRVQ